jgi:hypothetical protein
VVGSISYSGAQKAISSCSITNWIPSKMPRDGPTTHSDIFSLYLLYTAETEPPIQYHRWCYLTGLGALIGRKAHIDMGVVGRVFPNIYAMLLGEPAARKSTAIKMIKKQLAAAGFDAFSADKTSKEKFLLDLEGLEEDDNSGTSGSATSQTGRPKREKYDLTTADNLWGSSQDGSEPREVFIVADEFNEFAGPGNLDFYTTLGNLWDFDSPNQPFSQRLKNSRSVSIFQPTISILSGNTPELFARAFPPEAIGSGFLSRLLLIHGERSGRRITFPPPPDPILGSAITSFCQKLSSQQPGKMEIGAEAATMLDSIYHTEDSSPVTDIRFKAYSNRRFTQLLKLSIILSCAKFQKEVTSEDVLQANTILSHAEILMPKAMGEFGKARNSDVANKVMDVIERAVAPIGVKEIWAQVHKDLGNMRDLTELLIGLQTADRIQAVTGFKGSGFLPKKLPRKEIKFVDWSFLTQEERDMI